MTLISFSMDCPFCLLQGISHAKHSAHIEITNKI